MVKIQSSNFIHVYSFTFRKLCSHTCGLLLHNAFPLCLDISKITENQDYFGINKNEKGKGKKINLVKKKENINTLKLLKDLCNNILGFNMKNRKPFCAITFCAST